MKRRSAQNGKVAGASPATRTSFRVECWVNGLWIVGFPNLTLPINPPLHHSINPFLPACGSQGIADRFDSKPNSLGSASLPAPTKFGMSTGQAGRASMLTSACLRASGASPRHSAISEWGDEGMDCWISGAAFCHPPLAWCSPSIQLSTTPLIHFFLFRRVVQREPSVL